jgi:hypothetical protein
MVRVDPEYKKHLSRQCEMPGKPTQTEAGWTVDLTAKRGTCQHGYDALSHCPTCDNLGG